MLIPGAVAAQQVEMELRAGTAVGTYTETGAGLELVPGPSFGAVLEVWPRETLAAYLGFTRSSFGCEEGFCEPETVALTSQGLVLGGRWSSGLPWLRAGLVVQALTVDATEHRERYGAGAGFEVGAGIDWPVGERFSIRPGVTFRRHQSSTGHEDHRVALLALELGGTLELGRF